MDFLKSGSIHFKNSLIVTDIVSRVIVFSCILVPKCRYYHYHNLAQWTGDQDIYRIYNGSVIYYNLKVFLFVL